jgi:esterase/lipase superfamily enzyme
VDPAEIETYYKEQMVPKFAAGQAPSLAESRRKIRELLVQQQIDQQLSSWLDTLRSQARITRLDSPAESGRK